MALISYIIRQFYAPNPFVAFEEYAVLLNWLFGGILHLPTFWMVGRIYESGSCPPLGSLLYLIFYFINSFALQGLMKLYPHFIIMGVIVILYFVAYYYLTDKISN